MSLSPILQPNNAPTLRQIGIITIASALVAVIICGMGLMASYDFSPGAPAATLSDWPAAATLPRSADRCTLVLFLHPQCPCSVASLANLDSIVAEARQPLEAYVLFVTPPGKAEGWDHTSLWNLAKRMKGLAVGSDPDATEARRFGAQTSGQTFLFSQTGRLMYSGGITPMRGHSGNCVGTLAILSALAGKSVAHRSSPVFGCALYDSSVAPFRREAQQ